MIKVDVQAKILTAESNPYSVGGNEGVSHRIRISVDGEIYSCKSSVEQVASLVGSTGKEGKASVQLDSRKENLSLALVSFVPTK